MRDELRKIKSRAKETREFGLVVGGVLLLLGAVALWRGKPSASYLLTAGAALSVLGLIAPKILTSLQKAWMVFAVVMGFFMSRLILTVLFYGVVTPIGMALRLFGKDILDERIDTRAMTYWSAREGSARTKESYERQF